MNAFSNSLFTFLFGWARTLIEGVWNAAAEGRFSAFLSWLGDHWALVAALLCLICTAVDIVIWMIRWRPYLVWRTKWRRFCRLLRGERIDSQRRISKGYQDGVEIDVQAMQPKQSPAPEWTPEFEQAPASGADNERSWNDDAYVPQPGQPYVYFQPDSDIASEMPPARRRRRSDKHDTPPRRPAWHKRLTAADQEEDTMLDGLPPAVNREDAFHAPVYPTTPMTANHPQPANRKNA